MISTIKYAWCFWLFLRLIKGSQFECPKICFCRRLDLSVHCRNNQLRESPEGISVKTVHLDFSFNRFDTIPKNVILFKSLEFLNMSHNKISYLNSDSLEGLTSVKILDLSYNLFKDWRDIHNDAFSKVPFLLELNLSYNNFEDFPDMLVEYPLKSDSLEILDITNCSITNLFGDILLGMLKLQKVILAKNPLISISTQIMSKNLHTLDLTECSLQQINPDAFVELASLKILLLSKNYQLKSFHCRSNSVTILDLSHCNLESLPANSLPNLTKVSFSGNHLRQILSNNFESFPLLNSLDLSHNAIEKVDVKAFHNLKAIENIDLSFNTISHIFSETFLTNSKLYKLNLSRNYISEIGQLAIESLKWLDLSVCEIRQISRDNFIMMPKLQKLNLSRNLLSHIPNRLQADELNDLDLSMCGIFSLNNLTFISMGRLRSLNLSGNKITSGIKPSFFYGVTDLHLEDNSWSCDCTSTDFRQLYLWIVYELSSTSTLRCRSPENLAGLTWEGACQDTWFIAEKPKIDSMWMYSVSIVVLMTFFCCLVISIKHVYRRKAVRDREEREQEQEDACERLRQIQIRNLQYSRESLNRNAPDPRELQTPPSYAEAVSMPRLNVSCSSLAGSHRSLRSLHSSQPDVSRRTKLRRKRRRGKQENKSNISATQSEVSLSHAIAEDSSEGEIRLTQSSNNIIESSF